MRKLAEGKAEICYRFRGEAVFVHVPTGKLRRLSTTLPQLAWVTAFILAYL